MQWKTYLLHCSLRTLSLECCCSMSIPLLNEVSSCCSETIHINACTLALIFESFLDGVPLCFSVAVLRQSTLKVCAFALVLENSLAGVLAFVNDTLT